MENISISIDIIGKLKKIYEGKTFSDNLVVITELFQNSQRANAKEIFVKVKDGKLTFKDDGCGCKKPSDIYTLDYSSWNSTEEGFGIGLWSWLAVRDVQGVEIRSYNWKSTLTADQIFNDRNLNANVEYLEEKIKGFEVTIFSDVFYRDNAYVIDRIVSDGEMLECKVNLDRDEYFENYELIPKRDIHSEVTGEFVKNFNNRYFNATLKPNDRYVGVGTYYERRKIDNFYSLEYMEGVIEVKKDVLTLQEPDRKNVIRDDKLTEFNEKLAACRKELFINIVKSGDSSSIDQFSYEISRVLEVEDYEKYLLVDDLLIEVEEEVRNVGGFNPSTKANSFKRLVQAIDSFNNNTQLSLTENTSEEGQQKVIENLLNGSSNTHKWVKTNMYSYEAERDANCEELTEELLEQSNSVIVGNVVYKKVNVSEYKEMFEAEDEDITSSITVKATKNTRKKESLKSVIKKINKKIWVKAGEVEDYSDLIAKVEYYGVKVFIARNILHEKVFVANNVPYITEIESGIQKRNIMWDVELKTKKEERFIELLQPICYYYELPLNTFKIGYLKLLIETTLDGRVINREIIENRKNSINIYGVTDGSEIILDRRAIGLQRFNLSSNNIVGINEFKALLSTISTISHELAHLLYNTEDNTKEHKNREEAIYEELVNLYLTL